MASASLNQNSRALPRWPRLADAFAGEGRAWIFVGIDAVLDAMQGIALYHRPDDYVQTLKSRIEGQRDKAVQSAADEVIKPDQLTWVIVGDLDRIGPSVRALKLGPVQVLDTDGRPVAAKGAGGAASKK